MKCIRTTMFLFFYLLVNTCFVYSTIPNSITATISGGELYPFNKTVSIAITPDGTTAYAVNFESSTVNIIDVATSTVTGIVIDSDTTFGNPVCIAITPDGTKAYVGNSNSSSISIIDLTNTPVAVTGTVIGITDQVNSIAITPDGTTAYAVNVDNNAVVIIDVATDTVTGPVTDSGSTFNQPFSIAITPDGSTAYVGNLGTEVVIIDVATNTVTGQVTDSGSTFNQPTYIVITPNGATAYAVNQGNNTISVIDVATHTVTGLVTDSNSNVPLTNYNLHCMAITPDGTVAYVPSGPIINVIDVLTNAVVGIVVNPALENLYAIAITPDGSQAYIGYGNTYDDQMSILYTQIFVQAPTGITLSSSSNKFMSYEVINIVISWNPPTTGEQPIAYKIYRDSALTELVGTINGTGSLVYIDTNLTADTVYTYYIVSIDEANTVSPAASASITTQG